MSKDINKEEEKTSGGFLKKVRNYFFTGVLVTAPIAITLYLAMIFITYIDEKIGALIPLNYNPESYLPFSIPGLGLIVVFITLTLVGFFAAGIVGRFFVNLSHRMMARMPGVRGIYGALKQIFETVLADQSTAFRKVVLIEYPRKGLWCLAFLTGKTSGEVQKQTRSEVLNVFLPTTPNPTSGYLLFVPKEDVYELEMTIEEGLKMVISGGIITPPYPRGTGNSADRRPSPVRHSSGTRTPRSSGFSDRTGSRDRASARTDASSRTDTSNRTDASSKSPQRYEGGPRLTRQQREIMHRERREQEAKAQRERPRREAPSRSDTRPPSAEKTQSPKPEALKADSPFKASRSDLPHYLTRPVPVQKKSTDEDEGKES